MKYLSAGICIFLALAGTALASDAPPTDKSVAELLDVMNAHQLIDGMKGQIDAMLAATMRDAMRGKPVTPERQAIIDRMQARVQEVINQTLDWDTLRPVYMRTYSASFSQDEVNGMLKFYKSNVGQAVIKKLPLVLQNVMEDVQGMTKPMQKKLQQIQQETLQDLKALPES